MLFRPTFKGLSSEIVGCMVGILHPQSSVCFLDDLWGRSIFVMSAMTHVKIV